MIGGRRGWSAFGLVAPAHLWLTVTVFLPDAGVSGLLYSYPAIVIGLVHSFIPYIILTCYLSLQAIDATLLDAARSLGAARLTTFRRITFPLSLLGLIVGAVLIFVPVT